MGQPCIIDPPVRGQWAIFNPPWHPKLAFDFLAVNEGKSPYAGTGEAVSYGYDNEIVHVDYDVMEVIGIIPGLRVVQGTIL